MAVDFNHTIVSARDNQKSATFLAEILSLPAPRPWGPFLMVRTENGANIDFMNTDDEITPQHYAFLVSESEFDKILGRIRDKRLPYWADPGQTKVNEINHHDGGRGVYSRIPTGISWRSSRDRMAAEVGTPDIQFEWAFCAGLAAPMIAGF